MGSSEKERRRGSLDRKSVQDLCLKMSQAKAYLRRIRFGQEGRRSGRDMVDRIGVEREESEEGFAGRVADRTDRLRRLVPHLPSPNQSPAKY